MKESYFNTGASWTTWRSVELIKKFLVWLLLQLAKWTLCPSFGWCMQHILGAWLQSSSWSCKACKLICSIASYCGNTYLLTAARFRLLLLHFHGQHAMQVMPRTAYSQSYCIPCTTRRKNRPEDRHGVERVTVQLIWTTSHWMLTKDYGYGRSYSPLSFNFLNKL